MPVVKLCADDVAVLESHLCWAWAQGAGQGLCGPEAPYDRGTRHACMHAKYKLLHAVIEDCACTYHPG
jgi:hypothetical protein